MAHVVSDRAQPTFTRDQEATNDMNVKIESSLPPGQPFGAPPLGRLANEVTGSFRGERVALVKSHESLIQNAAEEMSFALAERRDTKSLAERKIGSRDPGDAEMAAKLEKLKEYLNRMSDPTDAQKLKQLADDIRRGGASGLGALMRHVRQSYDDVSDQYLALLFLQSEAGEGTDGTVATAIRDHIDQNGPAIRAGLNIAETVRAFTSSELGEQRELRNFYRTSVLGHEQLAQTYENILKQYGTKGFGEAVRFLIRALGDELNSDGPSMPIARLKPILDDIYQLGALNALHDDCAEVLARIGGRFGLARDKTACDVMKAILPLTTKSWIGAEHLAQVVTDLGVLRNIEAEIYLLRELTSVVRGLPPKIYTDANGRANLIAAAQAALDQAIAKEEAAEG